MSDYEYTSLEADGQVELADALRNWGGLGWEPILMTTTCLPNTSHGRPLVHTVVLRRHVTVQRQAVPDEDASGDSTDTSGTGGES